ncbi:hypothetical protein Tco_1027396 [Tanacetum coccineum]
MLSHPKRPMLPPPDNSMRCPPKQPMSCPPKRPKLSPPKCPVSPMRPMLVIPAMRPSRLDLRWAGRDKTPTYRLRRVAKRRTYAMAATSAMAGYDLSEVYVLKKLNDEKIKMAEKERRKKCITDDDEYENASPRSCLCWKFKKDRAISKARSVGLW